MSLTVLITNIVLANRSGTEVVVEQLADGLRRRGHRPVMFAQTLGPLAERMRNRGHIVTDRPDISPLKPDVIHGHHTAPTMAALAANSGVPALFVCHGAASAFDQLPPHPAVRRLFAVDKLCQARLIADGAAAERVELLPNAIDLSRIPPRKSAPDRPRRAVVLTKHANHLPAIRAACNALGIELQEFGHGAGRMTETPEAIFAETDLVFATARTALEAAAAGAGVVVCDGRGLAGFITPKNAADWLAWNLGAGILAQPVTAGTVEAAIADWNAGEVAEISALIRAQYGIERYLDRLETIYQDMIDTRYDRNIAAEAAATGAFISLWTPHFDQHAPWRRLADQMAAPPVDSPMDALGEAIGAMSAAVAAARSEQTATEKRLADQLALSVAALSNAQGMAGERIAGTILAALATLTADANHAHTAAAARVLAELRPFIERQTRPGVLPRLKMSAGFAWRRCVPIALRGPLHRLRKGHWNQ